MSTIDLSSNKIFFPLQPDLNILVAGWVTQLSNQWIYDDAYDLYEDLRKTIQSAVDSRYENSPPLTGEQAAILKCWLDNTPVKSVVQVLEENVRYSSERNPPKVTASQKAIIEECQKEVGLDFTPLFDSLSSWQGDSIVKGCLVVSEVQRQTGNRHFKPRHLRRAIREYIQRNWDEVIESQVRR